MKLFINYVLPLALFVLAVASAILYVRGVVFDNRYDTYLLFITLFSCVSFKYIHYLLERAAWKTFNIFDPIDWKNFARILNKK